MADARRTVNIAFDGNTNGLRRASADANQLLSRTGKTASGAGVSLSGLLSKFLLFGPLLLLVASAAKAAAGFILLVPAAILSLVAVIGVGAIAIKGFGDAVSAATPEDFVTATRSMSPAMRDAVNSVRRARPEFYALRRLVQEGFWSGFSTDLRPLLAGYLPQLTVRLPQIASGLAGIRSGIVEALLQPRVIAGFDKFLGLVSQMLINMRGSLGSFLSGFIRLAEIGGAFLPRFGSFLTVIADKFAAWVEAGAASGSIADFIEEAITTFRQLWEIVVNLGFAVKAIIDAVTSGNGLQALVNFSAALRAFFESPFAQTLLKTLTAVLGLLYNIIAAIVNAFSLIGGGGSGASGGGGFFAGLIGGIGNFFGGLFGRAGGGSVLPGQSYVVGERGREILTMGSSGWITPNGGTGEGGRGGGDVLVNVYIGETELRGIVETEVRGMVRDTARSVYSGLGVTG
jgi:hypothetical protein